MTRLNIPYQFVAGTKAKASEVNANFDAVATEIDSVYAEITTKHTSATSSINTLTTQITTVDDKIDDFLDTYSACTHFSINKGKINSTTGEADILSANSTLITFDVTSGDPIYATNYKGITFTVESIDDLSLPTLTDGTYTIYVSSTGVVNYYPSTYQCVTQLPDSPSVNQVCLITSTEPFEAYKYSGTAWEEFLAVPLGTFVISNAVVTEITTLPYNQNGYDINMRSFKANLAQNGWTKLPNGIIIQWGKYEFSASQIISFPIAFPHQCFAIVAGDNYNDMTAAAHINVAVYSKSQFKIAEGMYLSGEMAGKGYIIAIGY